VVGLHFSLSVGERKLMNHFVVDFRVRAEIYMRQLFKTNRKEKR